MTTLVQNSTTLLSDDQSCIYAGFFMMKIQDRIFFPVLVFVVLKSSKELNKNNKDQDASLKKKSLNK